MGQRRKLKIIRTIRIRNLCVVVPATVGSVLPINDQYFEISTL